MTQVLNLDELVPGLLVGITYIPHRDDIKIKE